MLKRYSIDELDAKGGETSGIESTGAQDTVLEEIKQENKKLVYFSVEKRTIYFDFMWFYAVGFFVLFGLR